MLWNNKYDKSTDCSVGSDRHREVAVFFILGNYNNESHTDFYI